MNSFVEFRIKSGLVFIVEYHFMSKFTRLKSITCFRQTNHIHLQINKSFSTNKLMLNYFFLFLFNENLFRTFLYIAIFKGKTMFRDY